jgi:hypothetical protein
MTKIAAIVSSSKIEGELEIRIVGLLGSVNIEPVLGTRMIKNCVYNEYNRGRLKGIGINKEIVVVLDLRNSFSASGLSVPGIKVIDTYPEII